MQVLAHAILASGDVLRRLVDLANGRGQASPVVLRKVSQMLLSPRPLQCRGDSQATGCHGLHSARSVLQAAGQQRDAQHNQLGVCSLAILKHGYLISQLLYAGQQSATEVLVDSAVLGGAPPGDCGGSPVALDGTGDGAQADAWSLPLLRAAQLGRGTAWLSASGTKNHASC